MIAYRNYDMKISRQKISAAIKKIRPFDILLFAIVVFFIIAIGKLLLQSGSTIIVEVNVTPDQWGDTQNPPPNWLALSINKGDKELNWNGQTNAEVLSVKKYDNGWTYQYVYLTLKLATSYNAKTKQHIFNNEPVGIGKTISLTLNSTSIKGLIVGIQGIPDTRKMVQKIVTVKMYDRYPWYADAIQQGDVMKLNNAVIADVVDKSVTNAEKTTLVLSDGNMLQINTSDPLRRDITLKLKMMLTEEDENTLIFRDDMRVKIGNSLTVGLEHVNLTNASVTAIE